MERAIESTLVLLTDPIAYHNSPYSLSFLFPQIRPAILCKDWLSKDVDSRQQTWAVIYLVSYKLPHEYYWPLHHWLPWKCQIFLVDRYLWEDCCNTFQIWQVQNLSTSLLVFSKLISFGKRKGTSQNGNFWTFLKWKLQKLTNTESLLFSVDGTFLFRQVSPSIMRHFLAEVYTLKKLI
jgi:hypothetical protein